MFLPIHARLQPLCNALLLFALIIVAPVATAAGGGKGGANPDFTKGEKIPEGASHTWNLGATGASGWMYSDRLTTIGARQIYITEVAKGSPAESVLREGDVLLGVMGKRFSYDARTEFGKALTLAESPEGRGRLRVIRWRSGATQEVQIRLPELGAYSATAPYDCPKSKKILEQGCAWLAEQMEDPKYRRNPYERSLNALALLASGDKQYLPLVKREAELAAASNPGGYKSWWYGPVMIFLSEYVIATGDKSVMPGLERLTLEAANGQSDVGSWGHRFALPEGHLPGYGMMNAPGVPMTIGLVLAREAGVKDPQLDLAIHRSSTLLRFYVGKGSIPYGDHSPWIQTHDDNGKNGMAAVLFHLLGDKEAAEYFSRMSVACHGAERDTGHTGNFFNITWSIPGINVSGPNAIGAWMKQFGAWHHDLARTHEGRFVHLGPPGTRPDRFNGWDCTGAYMLHYAMPLKQTRLTGKGKAVAPQITKAEAEKLVQDGQGWNNKDRNSFYDALSEQVLLDRLTSWSPVVRDRAGMALNRRKAEVLPQLIKNLSSDDYYTRLGACEGIQHLRGDKAAAVPALMKTLDADDMWLRINAAEAMQSIGGPAKAAAVPKLLERLAQGPSPADPRGMEQRYLSFVMFGRSGLIGRSVDGVDRELLAKAILAGLTNQDGKARSEVSNIYNQLTLEEIRPLLPAIHQAVIKIAPSGIMFASGVRLNGLRILAKHNVAEGLTAAVYMLDNQKPHGKDRRTRDILNVIVSYGVHAQAHLPKLEADLAAAEEEKRKLRHRRNSPVPDYYRDAIQKIKAATKKPELINLEGPRVGLAN